MTLLKHHATARNSRSVAAAIALFVLGLLATLTFAGSAVSAQATINLGAAESFGALSATAMTNAGGDTVVGGDVGSSTSIDAGVTNPGFARYGAGDPELAAAQASLLTAYGDAEAAPSTGDITGVNLAGLTYGPGVYSSSSAILISGPVPFTLDGGGDPNSVFIFQAVSDLTVDPTSSVAYTNGADPCNVFWKVNSAFLKNSGFTFVGTILALTQITLTDSITVQGRVLARNADVTFIHDTVVVPHCATPPGTTTGATTTGATTTGSTTTGTTTTNPPPPPPPQPPPPPPSPCHHGTGPLDPNPNSHVGPGTDFHAMLQAISDDLAARSYTGSAATRRAAVLNFLGNALVDSRWSSRGSPDTSDAGKYVLNQMLMGFKYLTTPNTMLCESAADLRADLIVLAGRIADQRFAEVVAEPGGSASLENQAGDSMAAAASNPMTQVALEQYLRVISLLKNEQPQFT